MDARKLNAMWKAWKRRNGFLKAIRYRDCKHCSGASLRAVRQGRLGWASWLVAIVVMVYSLIILVSPGTPMRGGAHWESGNK